MKYIKLIIFTTFVQIAFTGCSYVSDMIEGEITKRASFSIEAHQSGSNVVITWTETDTSSDFAGVEIYRTAKANDEYSGYITIADRYDTGYTTSLSSGTTLSCTVSAPTSSGIYLYRVGLINWDESEDERTEENGYSPAWPATGWDSESNYNEHTSIDEVSGYARVRIN